MQVESEKGVAWDFRAAAAHYARQYAEKYLKNGTIFEIRSSHDDFQKTICWYSNKNMQKLKTVQYRKPKFIEAGGYFLVGRYRA